MSVSDHLTRHWSNAVTLGCVVIAGVFEALQQAILKLPTSTGAVRLSGGWNFIPFILLVIGGIFWVLGKYGTAEAASIVLDSGQSPTAIVPGIPSISNLLGQSPLINFDAKEYFKRAYYSPVTAEVENNIKVIAHKENPKNVEDFYARFIGVGLVAFLHELPWAIMFKSQYLLLAELNKGAILPISQVKAFYDRAVPACPKMYAKFSFESWLSYLTFHQLVIRHPSDMVEITHRGKDFMKYLAHAGYGPDAKAC